MAQFVRVASVDDIQPGSMKPYDIGPDKFVIVHADEGFFAYVDECSHQAIPISDGKLEQHEIICRAHGARFDVKSGAATGPPAVAPLEKLELKIEGNDIYVRLDG
ncbi:MAG: non-heme iron oxygenase ferredoxin subunit [Candidatus Zixiibacteriota bacterium]|nr:MAG: non-heme iron oxygenase ferredoxin subunit [candidate division Zixibacteria bacterium]